MVGVVKRTLQRVVKKNLLEEGEFNTLITEVEFLVNERPLVDYERDGEQVLCPGDFLWPDYNNDENSLEYENKSQENDEPNISIQQNLINRYQNTRRMLQRLWKIWQEEYLEELRKRTRKSHKNPHSLIRRKPIIGEVVLLKGDGPRNSWKMGRVEKLSEGKDRLFRSAVVRLQVSESARFEETVRTEEQNPTYCGFGNFIWALPNSRIISSTSS
ncbi:unnamed protein product [Onchocerca ochengi]|uniref:DUF5641 domain-containing protein n=1 Tax=Onchocerca ochengi TaxID=42157 RepID=A0A182EYC0_ONCOC|nr:unnamed protein product [Onchocerca ochengi]